MTCEAARSSLGAYLDGEFVGGERSAVDRHLDRCAACRALFAEEVALAAAIERAVPHARASADLHARVARVLTSHRTRPVRWTLLAAGVAAVSLLAGAWYAQRRHAELPLAASPSLPRVAADTHLRYSRGQIPLDVRSDRPDEVSRWLSSRVPFHVALPDYPLGPGEEKFYGIEGGRLVSVGDADAAYVAYRMEGRPISLLVASASAASPSGSETIPWGGLTFHIESLAGIQVITWTDRGLTYALASDVGVSGARSCLVCHGAPDERRKIEGFRTGGLWG